VAGGGEAGVRRHRCTVGVRLCMGAVDGAVVPMGSGVVPMGASGALIDSGTLKDRRWPTVAQPDLQPHPRGPMAASLQALVPMGATDAPPSPYGVCMHRHNTKIEVEKGYPIKSVCSLGLVKEKEM
jgi:hypothetical protein